MILGVLSDTHGQRQRAAQAVHLLRDAGAEALIHCGDVGNHGVLEELAGWRAWVVFGNTDTPSRSLLRFAQTLGLVVRGEGPLRIDLDGHALAIFHGHEVAFAWLLEQTRINGQVPGVFGPCQYVLHGHTHAARDVRIGPLRVINPGALDRARTPTVATLDLETERVRFWPVEPDDPKTT